MARVVIENVSKIFKGAKGEAIPAVKDASLVVEDKEFLVLVGPSGCGKSTMLRLIAGLEEISQGTIAIDGQVVNDVEPKDRDIAMVFQNYALYPHMTVYENMAYGLKLRKFPKAEIEQRVNAAADILGLRPYLDRKPKALSGGQRQRVAVGRAIVRKPKVFLFDEPLSNLDAQMRVQTRAELSKLHTRLAATMIYVTHDQVEAMTMGDRIAVMRDGVIQQVADPLTLYHQPVNLFVAGFIGSPPMNLFVGKLLHRDGSLHFEEEKKAGGNEPGILSVRVGEAQTTRLADRVGQTIVFGIRPENIIAQTARPPVGTGQDLRAVVEVVEPMGSETYLYLTTGAHSFVARVHANERFTVSEKLSLTFDIAKAHFFDRRSEVRIAE
jgi:multiple sugar transport system ATP-binding protein